MDWTVIICALLTNGTVIFVAWINRREHKKHEEVSLHTNQRVATIERAMNGQIKE